MTMTHEDTMSHDIIRKQMKESTHFTISFAHLTDLLAEYDAVVAERDRLKTEVGQLERRCLDLTQDNVEELELTRESLRQVEQLTKERDRLRAIIREHVPYPASPDSETPNHSEPPNSSTPDNTPTD
jgi:DNA repair ATPase RecN